MKRIAIASILMLCSLSAAQAPRPKDGYVPNQEIAIQIAQSVLAGMYSKPMVKLQEPFHAELQGDVWEVYGKWNLHPNPNFRGGGGLVMHINKRTGEILGYYFTR